MEDKRTVLANCLIQLQFLIVTNYINYKLILLLEKRGGGKNLDATKNQSEVLKSGLILIHFLLVSRKLKLCCSDF